MLTLHWDSAAETMQSTAGEHQYHLVIDMQRTTLALGILAAQVVRQAALCGGGNLVSLALCFAVAMPSEVTCSPGDKPAW